MKMSYTEFLFHSDKKLFRQILTACLGASNASHFTAQFTYWLQFRDWFIGVHHPFVEELTPQLHQLMLAQYPPIDGCTDKTILEYINTVNKTNAGTLISQFTKLYREYNEKIDIRKKYPRIDEWREFYCKPHPPEPTDDKWRILEPELNEEQWNHYKAEEDRKMLIHYNWEGKRKTQYFDIVQPLIFKYLPDITQIEGDYWVIYAATLGDNYEEWKSLCEEIEITIEYKMPPESLNWKYEDWAKLYTKHSRLYPHVEAQHRARIHAQ